MANTFIKATQIASTGLGLLEREIVLPGLVWRNAVGDFAGAAGDTISIKVPARTVARTRVLRGARGAASEGTGIIDMDSLTETKVDVTLDTDVYSAVPITDEELTLDIADFGQQILEPQVRAIAEGIENAMAAEMTGATYAVNLTFDGTDPWKTLIDANTALNKANVPRSERVVVAGPDVEAAILKSDHLSRVDQSGSDSALRRAELGRLAGFPVYVSNAIPSNLAFAFHSTAYVMVLRAPKIPAGATFGSSQTNFGLAMRWIRDYDFRNVQDRSLVDTYITVQQRLGALSNLDEGQVTVTGGVGGPYTVTFQGATDVAALTATPTGGTGTVTIATATAGGSASFVRAVKLSL
jgi:hypothetical protein